MVGVAERHKLYEVDYEKGTIKLKNKTCPRCSKVMAKHADRWACGSCGYTEWVKAALRQTSRSLRKT
ncbi:MAG: 30S ribosomal protein S27ae [Candidatus Nezhaarchaeales archaeon]